MKEFELTIPKEYIDYINNEIKKPKRLNEQKLELWLERELNVENPGTYGNLSTDESHVEVVLLANGDYQLVLSDACFNMMASHVRPEPHSRKINNADILHFWLDIKTDRVHAKEHITVKEKA